MPISGVQALPPTEDISHASEMWHHHSRDRAAPGSMPEVPLAYLAFSALSRMPPSIRDLGSSFAFDTLTVPKCPLTIRLGALESPEKVWSLDSTSPEHSVPTSRGRWLVFHLLDWKMSEALCWCISLISVTCQRQACMSLSLYCRRIGMFLGMSLFTIVLTTSRGLTETL